MIDHFYYAAHDYIEGNTSAINEQKRVVFGSGVYANYNDLRDYKWDYSTNKYRIYGFSKSAKEKKIPCVFFGKTYQHTEDLRNHAYEVFDRDCRIGKPGKIVINGYYLVCNIVGTSNSNYLMKRRIDTSFTVVCADPVWHRDVTYDKEFDKIVQDDDSEVTHDFPFDFPFDFGKANTPLKIIENDCLVSCPFKLIIQGPCTDPTIIIAGHTYKVNGTLGSSETLEIVSIPDMDQREIIKYGQDRSATNWFGHRNKEASVFEPIPAGNIQVSWDGTFKFALTLMQERSEPPWFFEKPAKVERVITYWLDAYGDPILDAYGSKIEIGG